MKSPKQDFGLQSCSQVGHHLVKSSPTPHPIGSCRGLPCSSPLATPEFVPICAPCFRACPDFSVLLRFLLICFQNKSEQIRETPFCRPLFRKLEKPVAVPNSLLEKFSGKFRRCWKIIPRFSCSTKCYPCQGLFRQGQRLLEYFSHSIKTVPREISKKMQQS